jgi:hypothetical protein
LYFGVISVMHKDSAPMRMNAFAGQEVTFCRWAVAPGFETYGFNRDATGITYREWAPAAREAYLMGDFNECAPALLPDSLLFCMDNYPPRLTIPLHTTHVHNQTFGPLVRCIS